MINKYRTKQLSASILAADFANLQQECNAVLQAGFDYIHFDVMDHHFVPNLSFGAVVCKSLRKVGIDAPIDVHLMVDHPEDYIESFAKCHVDILTFHPETVEDVDATIAKIHAYGMRAGLAFNPDKPVNISAHTLKNLGMILLMSVFPGFAGQSFISETLSKIAQTRKWLDEHQVNVKLGVDGGVKENNINEISKAGADFFILGSGIFAAEDYVARTKEIRKIIG